YERVKSTRIRWKSDFHFPRPEVELNFSIERDAKNRKNFKKLLTLYFLRGIFIKHSMGNS
ncbi:hypothetical protein, partial [Holdemania massiliensis]|uniref:hypothetical protein n=1 Tax=Holdemania massiliensis TaxID=1468449 RepID=UPI0026767D83